LERCVVGYDARIVNPEYCDNIAESQGIAISGQIMTVLGIYRSNALRKQRALWLPPLNNGFRAHVGTLDCILLVQAFCLW
jgi:hypothetical protein